MLLGNKPCQGCNTQGKQTQGAERVSKNGYKNQSKGNPIAITPALQDELRSFWLVSEL